MYTSWRSFLAMVPDPGHFATEWRAKVVAAHARKSQKVAVGDVVLLTNAHEYKIVSIGRTIRGYDISPTASSVTYHIPRRMLVKVVG